MQNQLMRRGRGTSCYWCEKVIQGVSQNQQSFRGENWSLGWEILEHPPPSVCSTVSNSQNSKWTFSWWECLYIWRYPLSTGDCHIPYTCTYSYMYIHVHVHEPQRCVGRDPSFWTYMYLGFSPGRHCKSRWVWFGRSLWPHRLIPFTHQI